MLEMALESVLYMISRSETMHSNSLVILQEIVLEKFLFIEIVEDVPHDIQTQIAEAHCALLEFGPQHL